jgi:hypothetical protein
MAVEKEVAELGAWTSELLVPVEDVGEPVEYV